MSGFSWSGSGDGFVTIESRHGQTGGQASIARPGDHAILNIDEVPEPRRRMPITRPGLYACEQLPGMVAIAPEEGVGNHGRMMFVLWAGVKYRRSGADRNSRRCASALLHFPARTADGVPFRDICLMLT